MLASILFSLSRSANITVEADTSPSASEYNFSAGDIISIQSLTSPYMAVTISSLDNVSVVVNASNEFYGPFSSNSSIRGFDLGNRPGSVIITALNATTILIGAVVFFSDCTSHTISNIVQGRFIVGPNGQSNDIEMQDGKNPCFSDLSVGQLSYYYWIKSSSDSSFLQIFRKYSKLYSTKKAGNIKSEAGSPSILMYSIISSSPSDYLVVNVTDNRGITEAVGVHSTVTNFSEVSFLSFGVSPSYVPDIDDDNSSDAMIYIVAICLAVVIVVVICVVVWLFCIRKLLLTTGVITDEKESEDEDDEQITVAKRSFSSVNLCPRTVVNLVPRAPSVPPGLDISYPSAPSVLSEPKQNPQEQYHPSLDNEKPSSILLPDE